MCGRRRIDVQCHLHDEWLVVRKGAEHGVRPVVDADGSVLQKVEMQEPVKAVIHRLVELLELHARNRPAAGVRRDEKCGIKRVAAVPDKLREVSLNPTMVTGSFGREI